jgi:putative transposase
VENIPQEKKRQELMEFRYALIAELSNPFLTRGRQRELLKEKAAQLYEIPHSTKQRITVSCLKDWLHRYNTYGKLGLLPKIREDKGKSRIMSDQEISELSDYLLAHPRVTATAAYHKLYTEGTITSLVSSSSLSRIVVALGIREERQELHGSEEQRLKFTHEFPLECVQADCLHGPQVPVGEGKTKKAILIAFLDDATRRILYSEFSFSEHSLAFEKGLKHIVKTYGRVQKAYVDNGSTFVSKQTERIADIVKVHIIHSRPGKPRGRGKVERLMRTIRDKFLRLLEPDELRSIEDLNMRFHTWVETEYHRSVHRGLGGKITPLDAWLQKAEYIHPIDPSVDIDRAFYHEETRKVFNDATFTLRNTLYEVPAVLIGKSIRIAYDPHQPIKRLLISCEGTSYGEARLVDSYANCRVRRNIMKTGSAEGEVYGIEGHIAAGLSAAKITLPGDKS